MDCNAVRSILEDCLDGDREWALGPEVLAHLDSCEGCRRESELAKAQQRFLSGAFEPHDLPEDFTDAVMARVRAERGRPAAVPPAVTSVRGLRLVRYLGAAAALVVAAVLVQQLIVVDDQSERRIEEARARRGSDGRAPVEESELAKETAADEIMAPGVELEEEVAAKAVRSSAPAPARQRPEKPAVAKGGKGGGAGAVLAVADEEPSAAAGPAAGEAVALAPKEAEESKGEELPREPILIRPGPEPSPLKKRHAVRDALLGVAAPGGGPPPARPKSPRPAPRPEIRYGKLADAGRGPLDCLFLVDASASMAARPYQEQVDLVRASLRELREEDRFGVVTYDVDAQVFRTGLMPASAANGRVALAHLEAIEPLGATNIDRALRKADGLLSRRADKQRPARVVLTGDGVDTTGPARVAEGAAALRAAALDIVAIGERRARPAVSQLAAAYGGTLRHLELAEGLEGQSLAALLDVKASDRPEGPPPAERPEEDEERLEGGRREKRGKAAGAFQEPPAETPEAEMKKAAPADEAADAIDVRAAGKKQDVTRGGLLRKGHALGGEGRDDRLDDLGLRPRGTQAAAARSAEKEGAAFGGGQKRFEDADVPSPEPGRAREPLVQKEAQAKDLEADQGLKAKHIPGEPAQQAFAGRELAGRRLAEAVPSLELAGKGSEAYETLCRWRQVEPANPEIYRRIGHHLAGQGKIRDALRAFSTIVELDATSVAAHQELARFCKDLKLYDQALSALERVLMLQPGNAEAQREMKELQKRVRPRR